MSHTSGGRVLMPASSFGFVQLSHLCQLPDMAEVDHRHRLRSPGLSLSSHKTFSAGNRDFPPTYQDHRPSPWRGLFHVTITQITKIIR